MRATTTPYQLAREDDDMERLAQAWGAVLRTETEAGALRPDMTLRRQQAALCRREAVKARKRIGREGAGYYAELAALWDAHAQHWEEKVEQGARICALLDISTLNHTRPGR